MSAIMVSFRILNVRNFKTAMLIILHGLQQTTNRLLD